MNSNSRYNPTQKPDDLLINRKVAKCQRLFIKTLTETLARDEIQSWLIDRLTNRLVSIEKECEASKSIHRLIQSLKKSPKLSGAEVLLRFGKVGLPFVEYNEVLQSATSMLGVIDPQTKVALDRLDHALHQVFRECVPRSTAISKRYASLHNQEPREYMGSSYLSFVRAFHKWDAEHGGNFRSYLGKSFANQIAEDRHDERVVRAPRQAAREIAELNEAEATLEHSHGRAATDEELSARLGKSTTAIQTIRDQRIELIRLDAPLFDSTCEETGHDLDLATNKQEDTLIHPIDREQAGQIVSHCITQALQAGKSPDGFEASLLSTTLPIEGIPRVEGSPRFLDDAINALCWVGLQDLRRELDNEKNEPNKNGSN